MTKKIESRLDKLDAKLERLFNDLEKYDTAQLCKKPAPESWSAVQTLHHMMLSEKFSLAYCRKKLSFKPKLAKAGLTAAARAKFVEYYLLSPFKFKAPPFISGDALPEQDTLQNIREEWMNQRTEMRHFFKNMPAEYTDKEVYRHPFGGRLSLPGMLDFFGAHIRNHEKQIYRALK